MEELIRINKYLSDIGYCSRRKADSLVMEQRVYLDEKVVKLGDKVPPEAIVLIDGKPAVKQEKKVILAYYKPKGIECTNNREVPGNVADAIGYKDRLLYMGRLDKDSEGLLLMTNRGDLINKVMRAGNLHEKEYIVTVNKPVTQEFLNQMEAGVPILDTVTRRCKTIQCDRDIFHIILTQGLNRQIRRMCHYLGYEVTALKRVRIMHINLGDLKPGEYRMITEEEYKILEAATKNSYNIYGEQTRERSNTNK